MATPRITIGALLEAIKRDPKQHGDPAEIAADVVNNGPCYPWAGSRRESPQVVSAFLRAYRPYGSLEAARRWNCQLLGSAGPVHLLDVELRRGEVARAFIWASPEFTDTRLR